MTLRERLAQAQLRAAEGEPRHPGWHPVIFAVILFAVILGTGFSTGDAQGAAIVAAAILGYFLPSLISWGRRLRNNAQVVIVNTLLGWTFIGWVAALVMAARPRRD